jgi:DNA-directed RNA polymerase subunit L
MELNFLEDRKDSMVVELKGEEHTFPGLLCWALLKDSKVQVAVYDIPHPLIGTPHLHVKTKGETPKAALKKALKLIKKEIDSIDSSVSKIRTTSKTKGKK